MKHGDTRGSIYLTFLIQICSEGTQSPKPEFGGKVKDSRIQTALITRKLPGLGTVKTCILGSIRWYFLKVERGVFTSVWSYWTNSRRQVVFNLPIQAFPGSMGLRVKGYVVDLCFNGLQDSGLICISEFYLNFKQAYFSLNREPNQLFGKLMFAAFFQRAFPVICKIYFLMYILFTKSHLPINGKFNSKW